MTDSEPFSFMGTLIEGPDIDLLALAGLQLSEADAERLWDRINPRGLLLECESCEEVELDEIDEIPGLSDSYYCYECTSKADIAAELRERVLAHLAR